MLNRNALLGRRIVERHGLLAKLQLHLLLRDVGAEGVVDVIRASRFIQHVARTSVVTAQDTDGDFVIDKKYVIKTVA